MLRGAVSVDSELVEEEGGTCFYCNIALKAREQKLDLSFKEMTHDRWDSGKQTSSLDSSTFWMQ